MENEVARALWEVQEPLNKGMGHSTARSLAKAVEGGHDRSCYWITVNEWDKLRGYETLHPVMAQVPYIRKFFWESFEFARRMGWEERASYYLSLLAPYRDTEKQDRELPER